MDEIYGFETNMRVQNGTTTAHGRTWPLYERSAFTVEVAGSIDAGDIESAEALKVRLLEALEPLGVEVNVSPILVLEMSPEDQAEKNALDEVALREA